MDLLAAGSELQQPQHAPHRCKGDECNLAVILKSPDADLSKIHVAQAVLAMPTPYLAIVKAKEGAISEAAPGPHRLPNALRLHLLLAMLLV